MLNIQQNDTEFGEDGGMKPAWVTTGFQKPWKQFPQYLYIQLDGPCDLRPFHLGIPSNLRQGSSDTTPIFLT